MKTQNFIKSVNFLVGIFFAGLLSVSITGCGGGGGGSSSKDNPNNISTTTVTVLDGYIIGATVKDATNKIAVESVNGQYVFTGDIIYPVTSTGGMIDVDGDGIGDKIFDINMSAQNGTVISPLTVSDVNLSNLGISISDKSSDYLSDNNVEVAKMAQVIYFFEKEGKLNELQALVNNGTFTNANDLAAYLGVASTLSSDSKSAFTVLGSSNETNASNIESSIITFKKLADVSSNSSSSDSNSSSSDSNSSSLNSSSSDSNSSSSNSSSSDSNSSSSTGATVEWTGDVLNISNASTGELVNISDQIDVTKVTANFGAINHKYIALFDYQLDGNTTYINGYTGTDKNATVENVYVNATWGSEDNVTRLRFKLQNTETNHFDEWFIVKVK